MEPAAWTVIDEIAHKYIGAPYSRDQDRIVGLINLNHHKTGM